jgi:SAM-dependent methyltransferase
MVHSEEQERWDERYRENQLPWDTGQPSGELMKVLQSSKVLAGNALEFGCGYGTNAIYLSERGFDVTAVDISPTAIQEAERRAKEKRVPVDFRVADLLADPDLGGPYDFLFDRGVYHAVRTVDLDAFLKLLERVSHPGTIYLSLCGNANEEREFGPPRVKEEEIRQELGSLFEILELNEFRFGESPQMSDRPLGWSVLMRRKA